MEDLKELLVGELQDIYSAESQIVKALPKIAAGADSPELKEAIQMHLEETKGQVKRLDQIFRLFKEKAGEKHCKGMEGLLKEGSEYLEEEQAGPLRDLQLISAAQRVEHYEIAAYGTAMAMAEQLDEQEIVDLLAETLDQESQADQKLTEVAESIYPEVSAGSETEEDVRAEDSKSKKGPRSIAKKDTMAKRSVGR